MLRVCEGCTAQYAASLTACPNCQSTVYHYQGEPMPKNTRSRGATNAAVPEPEQPDQVDEQTATVPTMPALSAPKPEWQSYAAALGADDDVLSRTKTGIQDWVNENPPA